MMGPRSSRFGPSSFLPRIAAALLDSMALDSWGSGTRAYRPRGCRVGAGLRRRACAGAPSGGAQTLSNAAAAAADPGDAADGEIEHS
jgi:hypothetical protein